MNRRQRNLPLVELLIAICLLLTACGPAAEPARAELPPATIRWMAWETNNQGEAQLMRQFQAAYPQIDFERSSQDFTPGMYVIETPPPDLINVDVGWWLAQLARGG